MVDLYGMPCYYTLVRHGKPYLLLVGTYNIVQVSVLVNDYVRKEEHFVDSCKFTEFGLCVKTELLKSGRTQTWLESTVQEKTGLFVDSSYMYKILTGQRSAPKITQAICEILNLTVPTGERRPICPE